MPTREPSSPAAEPALGPAGGGVADAPAVLGPPPLELAGVGVRHEGRADWTPRAVDLRIGPGEVVLLLGPSGSGKSTLALTANGLIPHALPAELRGRVRAGGVEAAAETVARLSEHVAMVFQDPDAQIVTGTVLDEVAFGPENLRLPVDEVLARTEGALRQVGLWERRGENPDRLSGGGRQRLAIACALAMRTPLLVLDEPTANLDPAGIEEVYAVLAELVAEGRHAILLVEHNLDAALGLVDRVVVIDGDGRLHADGTPREILVDRVDELLAMGVWLPVATLAGLRLREAGIALPELPLTGAELTAALDAVPALPAPPSPPAGDPDPAPRPPAAVTVRGLTVVRRRTEILSDVDLRIDRGDFVAVVGTNGAGKSTLVRAIAGVVPPPRGAIDLAGVDPARADARTLSERVGFVFQNPEHQFVTQSVGEELAYGLTARGLGEAEARERVEDVLARFALAGHRDVHPYLLSGGQKRRLSVGTALIGGAPLLVLDEPTFGQDRARAAELLGLLTRLNREGTTVVIVTHDMQLVADHASHVAVLAGGRLVRFDTAARVLADEELLRGAGLRLPPLARAMRGLERHPSWRGIGRLSDLPGGDA